MKVPPERGWGFFLMQKMITEEQEIALMTQRKIAIQGVAGAFHDIAVQRYFDEEMQIVPADTFKDLVTKVEESTNADLGIMAIENSIYGSIIPNYNLIRNSDLQITGEVFLRIQQNLMVFKGQTIDQITEVYSHPVAIAQCEAFFQNYPHIQLIETDDTAASARMIKENNWKHAGAIASSLAAEIYDMEIIHASIEMNKRNYTRFLIVERTSTLTEALHFNKVSMCFALSHEVGSLHKILAGLAACNANLTKIQSVPIIGRPWEYRFFIDFLLEDSSDFERTMQVIQSLTIDRQLLGKYIKGKHHDH